MSVYNDFQKFVNDLETSSTFKNWCSLHAADCAIWKTYRTGLLNDTPSPSAPAISTNFGKALVDVGIMAVNAGLVAPPPPPPPSPLTAAFSASASNLVVIFSDHSTPGPSGPITAWHWDFGDGNTSTVENPNHTYAGTGTYNVQLVVTGSGSDGTATVTHPVSVTAISPGGSFEQAINVPRPAFSPTRTIHFHDEATFVAALQGMQDGDLIQILPGAGKITISRNGDSGTLGGGGQVMKLYNRKMPTKGVVIDLGTFRSAADPSLQSSDYTEFENTNPNLKEGYNAFFLQSLAKITLYGGSFTGRGGGILAYGDLTDVQWYDYYTHNTATGGCNLLPVSPNSNGYTRCLFRGEVTRAGLYPTLDPHADKGTGIHGQIFENSAPTTGSCDDVTCMIYAHELGLQPGETSYGKVWPEGSVGGGGVSLGNSTGGAKKLDNIKVYFKVNNGYMHPGNNGGPLNPGSTGIQKDGTVGMNFWGNTPFNGLRLKWAEANGITGNLLHLTGSTGSGWTHASPGIVVEHGRTNNTRLYPYGCVAPNNVDYPAGYGLTYNDCT